MKLYTFRTRPEAQEGLDAAITAALAAIAASPALTPSTPRTPEEQAQVDRFSLLMRLVETTETHRLPTLLALVEGFVVERLEGPDPTSPDPDDWLRGMPTDGRTH